VSQRLVCIAVPLTSAVVVVDDGEGDEVTLLTVRARMFHMEKGTGWKERGAGMLKVNVPKSTIELDDSGIPIKDSFDASVLEDDVDEDTNTRQNVRLIMRQDHTLRVILNTAIVPAMKFQLTQTLKAAHVLFTAFEGGEAKQVQMKASRAHICIRDERANANCHVVEPGKRWRVYPTGRGDTEAAR
jgi:hypothetical protein